MIKTKEVAERLGYGDGKYASVGFYKLMMTLGVLERNDKGYMVTKKFKYFIDDGVVEQKYTNRYGWYLLWDFEKLNAFWDDIADIRRLIENK